VNPLQDQLVNPLRIALDKGHEGIVRRLSEAGADVNAQWCYGTNVLIEANWFGSESAIHTVFQQGLRSNPSIAPRLRRRHGTSGGR
jgi:ankyrin repeat protein